MKKFPLSTLHAYLQIYRAGSIRQAARDESISHSALSRSLKELEKQLGVSLTEKQAVQKGLHFSRLGHKLGRFLETWFRDLDVELATIQDISSDNKTVTISTTPSVASCWLMPRLPQLENAYPNIQIRIAINQNVQNVETGDFDIGIRMGTGLWDVPNRVALMDDWLSPVVHPSQISNVESLSFIHDGDPEATWAIWSHNFSEHPWVGKLPAKLSRGMVLRSSELVLQAAASGQGVALGRLRLAHGFLEGQMLREVDPAYRLHLEDAYWLIGKARHHQTSAVKRVWDWLLSEAAKIEAIK
ncbi:MAG: LysR family transcriptional regulator [Alphaproteobacteria bacterium]|nr:LysR family transcriptional regulator [Alphaproteobacteria bacterium]